MNEAKNTSFEFLPPPEAPVFRPSTQEFADPMEYLIKISPMVKKTGIARIIPPENWNPPFAVDINKFKFTPRVQRLYELEAQSRIKLNFISRLYQFTKLQGKESLKIPRINGTILDVYKLYKLVSDLGGFDRIEQVEKWSEIAVKLGLDANKALSVKSHYKKLLLAFEYVLDSRDSDKRDSKFEDVLNIDYTANKELKNLQFFGPGPKAAVPQFSESDEKPSVLPKQDSKEKTNCEYDQYACKVCKQNDDENNLLICENEICQSCYHIYCLNPPLSTVPRCTWRCPECVRSACNIPTELYGFPQSAKTYTLSEFGVHADQFKAKYFDCRPDLVPTTLVEYEFWRILQEYNDDVIVEYGADIHSSEQGSGFPTECQLRRLTSEMEDEDDGEKTLDSFDNLNLLMENLSDTMDYAQSPWNLNNLPVLSKSILRFIPGDINGMKVPWCYVGMVFSSFCWHIEDHWSYSINFNHWGEPKTWYGVPSLDAPKFEEAMKKQASELFEQAPDLLHHITTTMNPNILQKEGVSVYRTDQHAGEFVVTFPRAYHAGFNQGFNFAEAVNFCLPDWLPMGRECVDHYVTMRRQCVFSNEELLWTLAEVYVGDKTVKQIGATIPETVASVIDHEAGVDEATALVVYNEMLSVLKEEEDLRAELFQQVKTSIRWQFPDLNDDARTCLVCRTTLFLSSIGCQCQVSNKFNFKYDDEDDDCCVLEPDEYQEAIRPRYGVAKRHKKDNFHTKMVCLKHAEAVCDKCSISDCTLYYYCTLDEFRTLMERIKDNKPIKDTALDTLNKFSYVYDEFRTHYEDLDPVIAIEAGLNMESLENCIVAIKHRKALKAGQKAILANLHKFHADCRRMHEYFTIVENMADPLCGEISKRSKIFLRLVKKVIDSDTDQVNFSPTLYSFEINTANTVDLRLLVIVMQQYLPIMPEIVESDSTKSVKDLVDEAFKWEAEFCQALKRLRMHAVADASLTEKMSETFREFNGKFPERFRNWPGFKRITAKTSLIRDAMDYIQNAEKNENEIGIYPRDLANLCFKLSVYVKQIGETFISAQSKERSSVPESLVPMVKDYIQVENDLELSFTNFASIIIAKLQCKLGRYNELRCQVYAMLTILLESFNSDYCGRTTSAILDSIEALKKMKVFHLTKSPGDLMLIKAQSSNIKVSSQQTIQLSNIDDILSSVNLLQIACRERIEMLLNQRNHSVIPIELHDTMLLLEFLFEQIPHVPQTAASKEDQKSPIVAITLEWYRFHRSLAGLRSDIDSDLLMIHQNMNSIRISFSYIEAHNQLVELLLPKWCPEKLKEDFATHFIRIARQSQEAAEKMFLDWHTSSFNEFTRSLYDTAPCSNCLRILILNPNPEINLADSCQLCPILQDTSIRISYDSIPFDLVTCMPGTTLIKLHEEMYDRFVSQLSSKLNPAAFQNMPAKTLRTLIDIPKLPNEIYTCLNSSFKVVPLNNRAHQYTGGVLLSEMKKLHASLWLHLLHFRIRNSPIEKLMRELLIECKNIDPNWRSKFSQTTHMQ